jgi:hypothetical protein
MFDVHFNQPCPATTYEAISRVETPLRRLSCVVTSSMMNPVRGFGFTRDESQKRECTAPQRKLMAIMRRAYRAKSIHYLTRRTYLITINRYI